MRNKKNLAVGAIVLAITAISTVHAYNYASIKKENQLLNNHIVTLQWQLSEAEHHYFLLQENERKFIESLNKTQSQAIIEMHKNAEQYGLNLF